MGSDNLVNYLMAPRHRGFQSLIDLFRQREIQRKAFFFSVVPFSFVVIRLLFNVHVAIIIDYWTMNTTLGIDNCKNMPRNQV